MTYAGFKTTLLVGMTLTTALWMASEAAAQGPRKGLDVTFEELDADQDGAVTPAELAAHRAARFATLDANGDGQLSVAEIEAGAQARAAKRAQKMVDRFDANDDGQLSAEEMPGARRAERILNRLDSDEDGAISAEEFAAARDKMRKRHRGHKADKN